jgi:hypothetical protein
MPRKIHWTPAQDETIRRMRAAGASWDAIAATFSVSRYTIIFRGRAVGALRPPKSVPPAPPVQERLPLPAGHPLSWRALTDGTVLEGSPYPYPVFV